MHDAYIIIAIVKWTIWITGAAIAVGAITGAVLLAKRFF